ncbi:MAG: glycine cleavage system protein GcvH [Kiritimatiellaeota bacterium]|nr:glycine cleavage system protein GcvH [Kiritimatiellota bacterium]
MNKTPTDRLYLESHEWVRIEGDLAVVGITDHAQDALGDITYVELPEVGQRLTQGSECGSIESVKAASDLFSPLSGTVGEINPELEDAPEIINEDPYGKGWMFKLRDLDAGETGALLDAAAYEKLVEEEA